MSDGSGFSILWGANAFVDTVVFILTLYQTLILKMDPPLSPGLSTSGRIEQSKQRHLYNKILELDDRKVGGGMLLDVLFRDGECNQNLMYHVPG